MSEIQLIKDSDYNADMLCMARDMRGLSSRDLAAMTGIRRRTICVYCRGVEPTPEHLALLQAALEVPPTFFYREGEYFKRDPRYPLDMHVPLPSRNAPTRADAIALIQQVPDDEIEELVDYLRGIASVRVATRFDGAGDSEAVTGVTGL